MRLRKSHSRASPGNRPHLQKRQGRRLQYCFFVQTLLQLLSNLDCTVFAYLCSHSPVLIRLGGCRTKGNSTRNRSQDSWHAMEVVHTTSVVELDDALQQRLESDT